MLRGTTRCDRWGEPVVRPTTEREYGPRTMGAGPAVVLAEPQGVRVEGTLLDCWQCDLVGECRRQVLGLGTFVRWECEMAISQPASKTGLKRGRRKAGLTERQVLLALGATERLSTDQLRAQLELGRDAVYHALVNLLAEGRVVIVRERLGNRPRLWSLAANE